MMARRLKSYSKQSSVQPGSYCTPETLPPTHALTSRSYVMKRLSLNFVQIYAKLQQFLKRLGIVGTVSDASIGCDDL